MRQALNRKPGARTAVSKWLLRSCLALSCAPAAAYAQFALGIALGIPPPVAVAEAAARARPGYVYAPDYLPWHGERWILERPGHFWVADHLEPVGGRWHFVQAPQKHEHERKHERGRDHE